MIAIKQRRFVDSDDLLCQLAEWHVDANTKRPSRATGVIPAVRFSDEQPRLRPLRVAPKDLALRLPLVVDPTGHVVHDTHAYSMPPTAVGLACTLWLYRDRVKIVAGGHVANHERKFARGESSTLPEHRARRVEAVPSARAKCFVKREHLFGLGAEAVAYITEVILRRAKVWIRDIDELHDLLEAHGDRAVRVAFTHCLQQRVFGHEYIAHHLNHPIVALGVQQELFS